MRVLYDAPGTHGWITINEEHGTRSLLLNGCEEGAMALATDEPVFNYAWLHKCSWLIGRPLRRALVLGAGAFSVPKCLAIDFPSAEIDAVDAEGELAAIARRFFRLDLPAFGRIYFHGCLAETFLADRPAPYDFIYDDLFDGFQHVPLMGRSAEHVHRLHDALAGGGICLKNLIWNPLIADTRSACTEVMDAWRATFPEHAAIVLGDPDGGHNLLLLGAATSFAFDWTQTRQSLVAAGVPGRVLEHATFRRSA
jgi:spermidine synthase